jgi:hypothetical protein
VAEWLREKELREQEARIKEVYIYIYICTQYAHMCTPACTHFYRINMQCCRRVYESMYEGLIYTYDMLFIML